MSYVSTESALLQTCLEMLIFVICIKYQKHSYCVVFLCLYKPGVYAQFTVAILCYTTTRLGGKFHPGGIYLYIPAWKIWLKWQIPPNITFSRKMPHIYLGKFDLK